jgi:hypothetical protein
MVVFGLFDHKVSQKKRKRKTFLVESWELRVESWRYQEKRNNRRGLFLLKHLAVTRHCKFVCLFVQRKDGECFCCEKSTISIFFGANLSFFDKVY